MLEHLTKKEALSEIKWQKYRLLNSGSKKYRGLYYIMVEQKYIIKFCFIEISIENSFAKKDAYYYFNGLSTTKKEIIKLLNLRFFINGEQIKDQDELTKFLDKIQVDYIKGNKERNEIKVSKSEFYKRLKMVQNINNF